ncbi:MAG: DUF6263 family protein [Paludibacter sp.]|nr:DUF6263 family protein [Paludibacter sp.]
MKQIPYLLLSLLLFFSCKQEKQLIVLNLEKGHTYTYETNADMTTTQTMNGMPLSVRMGITGIMKFTVVDVKDTVYDMNVMYDKMEMKMYLPTGSMEFSSEKKDADELVSQMLSQLTQKSFQVKMSNTGKILDVSNLDKLYEDMLNAMSPVDPQKMAQAKAQLEQTFGAESFKSNMEMGLNLFTNKPVTEGDKWKIESKISTMFGAVITNEYELESIDKKSCKIKGVSEIHTTSTDFPLNPNGIDMKYNLEGTASSAYNIDCQTGWIVSATIEEKMDGEISVGATPQLPDGMKVPMTITIDMKINGKD